MNVHQPPQWSLTGWEVWQGGRQTTGSRIWSHELVSLGGFIWKVLYPFFDIWSFPQNQCNVSPLQMTYSPPKVVRSNALARRDSRHSRPGSASPSCPCSRSSPLCSPTLTSPVCIHSPPKKKKQAKALMIWNCSQKRLSVFLYYFFESRFIHLPLGHSQEPALFPK